jgi:hypothetical protein
VSVLPSKNILRRRRHFGANLAPTDTPFETAACDLFVHNLASKFIHFHQSFISWSIGLCFFPHFSQKIQKKCTEIDFFVEVIER